METGELTRKLAELQKRTGVKTVSAPAFQISSVQHLVQGGKCLGVKLPGSVASSCMELSSTWNVAATNKEGLSFLPH